MNKPEVVAIIKNIVDIYGGKFKMDDPQGTVNAWYSILKDYEFETIHANLIEYVKANKFVPSVADLIHATERRDRALPTIEETNQLLLGYEQAKEEKADPEQAEAALAKMRKLLKIERG